MPYSRIGTYVPNTLLWTSIVTLITWSWLIGTPQTIAATKEGLTDADNLLRQGIEEYQSNKYKAAIEAWQQALTIYQEQGKKPSEQKYSQKALLRKQGKTMSNLASAYYSLGEYSKAIDYYQQRLILSRSLGDRYGEGKTLNSLGRVYYELGKYTKALGLYKQSLAIADEIKIPQGQAVTLTNLGQIYAALGDYSRGINYYQHSVTIARKIGESDLEMRSLAYMAIAYKERGQLHKAIDYFKRSLKLAREIGDREIETISLNNIGIIYYELKQYDTAIKYQEKYLDLAKKRGTQKQQAESLDNLGNIYYARFEYNKALNYQQQGLALAKKIETPLQEAKSLANLAITYNAKEDTTKAIDLARQSLALAKEIKAQQQQLISLGNLGTIYYGMGEYDKAVDYYQQQLSIIRAIGIPDREEIALTNLGKVYLALGDNAKAIEAYKQILGFVRRQDKKEDEAKALVALSKAYLALGNYTRAIEYLKPYLEVTQKIGDRKGKKVALEAIGLAFWRTGNLEEAQTFLAQSIGKQGSIPKSLDISAPLRLFLSQQQANPYHILQKVFIAKNKPEKALEIAEKEREENLRDLFGYKFYPQPELLRIPPSSDRIQEIAQKQKATLVTYSLVSATELYIWVIKPTGEIIFSSMDLSPTGITFPQSTLKSIVDRTISSMGANASNVSAIDRTRLLKQLDRILIEPIAYFLPKDPAEPIIFIPPKELFLVPFVALQDKQGKYLIEKHTISIVPSIEILDLAQENQQHREKTKDVLVVASINNSAPIASALQPLAIAQNLNSETAVKKKMPTASVIHLSTKSLFDGKQSAIALTASDRDDGWLTAVEILEMNLNGKLVVLNSKNLRIGSNRSKDIMSLSSSFISVGIESVIIPLWSTPDTRTTKLMKEFYHHWLQGSSKAKALRQAMLTTMKTHPQPQDWAAFSLVGEQF
ncbi:MAG: tetratricopeptide repeat protein [Prochloraceae cyanobacterium]|nr:tetratricopeptide repeat protein [Prochloraceae cyanobacterium]